MKNSFKVFRYEFSNAIKSKALIISIIISFLAVLVITAFPSIRSLVTGDEAEETPTIICCIESDAFKEILPDFLPEKPRNAESLEELKRRISEGKEDTGVYIAKDGKAEIYVKNRSLREEQAPVTDAVTEAYRFLAYKEAGIDYAAARSIDRETPPIETKALGTDQQQTVAPVYFMIFIVYFLVIMNGNLVTTAVAREKNDRTMEILITSTSAKSLINGKVAAYGVVGILWVLAVLLAGKLGRIINEAVLDISGSPMIFGLDGKTVLVYFVFFLTGYLLYLYLYAALGATVSKVEDAGTVVAPVMIFFIIGFIAALYGTLGNADALLFKISTYIPFFSMMTMFVAVAMGTATKLQVILSFSILIASTIFLAFLSIKIYRAGTLNYGNKKGLKSVFGK